MVVGVERQGKKDTSLLEGTKDKDKDKDKDQEKDSDGPSSSSAKSGAGSASGTRYLVDVLVNSDAPASQAAAAAAAAAAGGQQAAAAAPTSESSALARLLPPQAKRGTPQVVTVALSQASWIVSNARPGAWREAGNGCIPSGPDGRVVTGKSLRQLSSAPGAQGTSIGSYGLMLH